jgi:hypothetical protein
VLFDRRFKVDPSIPHFLYLAMVALTLLSAVLLAATAVAFPSSNERHAARLSGRRNGRGSSLPMNVTVHATENLLTANGPTTMSSVTSTNWAGGVYSYPQVGVLWEFVLTQRADASCTELDQGGDGDVHPAQAAHTARRQRQHGVLLRGLGRHRRGVLHLCDSPDGRRHGRPGLVRQLLR